MLDGLLIGFQTASTPYNLMMVCLGCFAGTFIGMLPGLGPVSAVALMIPVTYGLEPSSGLILMAGVYYGAVFGGSTSSILLNAPGCASTVVTTFDGFPLAQRGRAGKALALAAYASFTGGTIGALAMMVAAPALARVSLGFQSADYFALMLLGLTSITALAGRGKVVPAVLMAVLGVMLSTVGTESTSGLPRYTFGRMDLVDGLSFLLLAMATFALAEVLLSVRDGVHRQAGEPIDIEKLGSMRLAASEVKDVAPAVGRSSIFGFVVGILPGAGATIASFLAYGMERKLAKGEKAEEFGQGSLRGIAAPEAANNAASTGSFVPMLTLGIPGSGTTAIMLGALIAYGIQPGPRLLVENPEIFWSVIVSMYVGNLVLLILNLPLIPYLSRLLSISRAILIPIIITFCMIGVYLVSFNNIDVLIMVVVAAVAIVFRLLGFPMAPMLLGFILGGYLENNLQRALIIYDGSFRFLWERPSTLVLVILTLLILAWPVVSRFGFRMAGIAGRPRVDVE